MEWQQYAGRRVRSICRVGLLECRTLVGEPTYAAVASEIMVEGTIFLDEDDCSMSVNWEQTDGPVEVPPPLHPGNIMAASSAAAAAAPIFNKSRRVTFLEVMGSFVPSFHCVGLSKLTRYPSTPDVRPLL